MKITIKGSPKEIAKLTKVMQARLNSNKLNAVNINDQLNLAIQDALKSICDTTPEFQR